MKSIEYEECRVRAATRAKEVTTNSPQISGRLLKDQIKVVGRAKKLSWNARLQQKWTLSRTPIKSDEKLRQISWSFLNCRPKQIQMRKHLDEGS